MVVAFIVQHDAANDLVLAMIKAAEVQGNGTPEQETRSNYPGDELEQHRVRGRSSSEAQVCK
ncbi:hypothetical protein D3C84_1197650 [compost metagenome]